jgi:hypothetical protein
MSVSPSHQGQPRAGLASFIDFSLMLSAGRSFRFGRHHLSSQLLLWAVKVSAKPQFPMAARKTHPETGGIFPNQAAMQEKKDTATRPPLNSQRIVQGHCAANAAKRKNCKPGMGLSSNLLPSPFVARSGLPYPKEKQLPQVQTHSQAASSFASAPRARAWAFPFSPSAMPCPRYNRS